MAEHHYFASTAQEWQAAPTRQAAIEAVARRHNELWRRPGAKQAKPAPVPVVSCRVEVPLNTPYRIEQYLPKGVVISDVATVHILNNKGACVMPDDVGAPNKWRITAALHHIASGNIDHAVAILKSVEQETRDLS